jgi:hypothetical protein
MSLRITDDEIAALTKHMSGLIGVQFSSLALPVVAIEAFEPSQVGTIVGSLMDALIPHLPNADAIGLRKAPGILGDREGYPDYTHGAYRLELKLIYVDNPSLKMKRPPTRREPSARLTQKVTVRNVKPQTDAMLLISYQLQPNRGRPDAVSPTIVDYRVFPMSDLIDARDQRLSEAGGRWSGDYQTPLVLSKKGKAKRRRDEPLDTSSFGRKESEGKDYNEDTNFGKLKRIPYQPLQQFIKECQARSLGVPIEQVDLVSEEPSDGEASDIEKDTV